MQGKKKIHLIGNQNLSLEPEFCSHCFRDLYLISAACRRQRLYIYYCAVTQLLSWFLGLCNGFGVAPADTGIIYLTPKDVFPNTTSGCQA